MAKSLGLLYMQHKHLHFTQRNNLSLSSLLVDFHHTHRCPNAHSTLNDVTTQNDRVSVSKGFQDLETNRPDGVGGGLFSLGFLNLGHVLGESIEEMVDNHS